MTGYTFTWEGRRFDEHTTPVRLTREGRRAFGRQVARIYRVPIALLGMDPWGCPPPARGWRYRKGRAKR